MEDMDEMKVLEGCEVAEFRSFESRLQPAVWSSSFSWLAGTRGFSPASMSGLDAEARTQVRAIHPSIE